MDRVAIVGIGQTKIEASKERQNYPEMVYEAVKLALEDAGVGMEEVDNVVTTSNDFWDGRTISCMPVGGVSELMEVPGGFALLKVLGRSAGGTRPFEEVRGEIEWISRRWLEMLKSAVSDEEWAAAESALRAIALSLDDR